MHKSATKCNETLGKWCKNKHGASKIIDTFQTYQQVARIFESIPESFLTIASGDTPIGSAGRAPGEMQFSTMQARKGIIERTLE
jgi:hypothetical protein